VLAGGDTYQAIREGKLALLPTFSNSFRMLLAQMMAPKPADRPTADKLLANPLLNPYRASPSRGTASTAEHTQAYGGLNLVKSSQSARV
jgi:serine/threonine protein kinase